MKMKFSSTAKTFAGDQGCAIQSAFKYVFMDQMKTFLENFKLRRDGRGVFERFCGGVNEL